MGTSTAITAIGVFLFNMVVLCVLFYFIILLFSNILRVMLLKRHSNLKIDIQYSEKLKSNKLWSVSSNSNFFVKTAFSNNHIGDGCESAWIGLTVLLVVLWLAFFLCRFPLSLTVATEAFQVIVMYVSQIVTLLLHYQQHLKHISIARL